MRIELVADEAPVAPIRQSFGGRGGGGRGGRFNGGNRLVILSSCLHFSKCTVFRCSYLENKSGKADKVTQGGPTQFTPKATGSLQHGHGQIWAYMFSFVK